MFTEREIEALVLGARVVQSWGDPALAKAASDALNRVEAALPEKLRLQMDRTPLYAPGFHVRQDVLARLSELRGAIDGSFKVKLDYRDARSDSTVRVVRPLGLFFWGAVWSLEAWCELRNDFRAFRLDRMESITVTGDTFVAEPGKTLDDMLAKHREEAEQQPWTE
jgi:predicted DNA-binding transcriptional regulator YafY